MAVKVYFTNQKLALEKHMKSFGAQTDLKWDNTTSYYFHIRKIKLVNLVRKQNVV